MEYTTPPVITRQVSVAEAARELRISPETVRRWIKSGRLQADRAIRPQGTAWLVTLPVSTPRGVLPVTVVTTPHEVVGQELDQDSDRDITKTTSNDACYPSLPVAGHMVGPGPLVESIARLIAELAEVRVISDRRTDQLVGMAERVAELERENGRESAELERSNSAVVALGEEVERLRGVQTLGPTTELPAAIQGLWARPWRLLMVLAALIMVVVLLTLPR